jgi:hypothetical protein
MQSLFVVAAKRSLQRSRPQHRSTDDVNDVMQDVTDVIVEVGDVVREVRDVVDQVADVIDEVDDVIDGVADVSDEVRDGTDDLGEFIVDVVDVMDEVGDLMRAVWRLTWEASLAGCVGRRSVSCAGAPESLFFAAAKKSNQKKAAFPIRSTARDVRLYRDRHTRHPASGGDGRRPVGRPSGLSWRRSVVKVEETAICPSFGSAFCSRPFSNLGNGIDDSP